MNPNSHAVTSERDRRLELWQKYRTRIVPYGELVDDYSYTAGRGIFRGKSITGHPGPDGVTLSVLHLGTVYEDDLEDDLIGFHYPRTKQPAMDLGEIRATKAAGKKGSG